MLNNLNYKSKKIVLIYVHLLSQNVTKVLIFI